MSMFGMGKKKSKDASKMERVLLAKDFVPVLYDLCIETNLQGNFRFEGKLDIQGVVNKATKVISLHAKEVFIETCSFKSSSGFSAKPKSLKYDKTWNVVSIEFEDELPLGDGILSLEYTGIHNDQMCGFYRSSYKDKEGNDVIMLCTQFESLDARRCFPCVDEPAAKAVFKCSLVIPDGLVALGNMPVESNTLLEDGKRRKVVFGETPKMSTYLLAFVVGDLEYVEQTSSNGVLIRVYTRPGLKEQGTFALDVAAKALDLYDGMFEQPYPLPKLDMVAIPDFAAGAMENWGLVTYRDVVLTIDSETSSSYQKQMVAIVVAHELAHQWFGNLVTMEWWSGLWLNEGFASWMESHCVATLFPSWNKWEQFVEEDQNGALSLDALVSSHPIQVPIKHAEEVESVFDSISYLKGASVVRLIHSYLGNEMFVKGLQLYMERFKFSNAETDDLWNAWEEASNKPVKKVMDSWVLQMGFPVVKVESLSWDSSNSKCTVELSQKWFLGDGSEHPDAASKLWNIPIFIALGGSDPINVGLMETRKATFVVPSSANKKTWIKINGGQFVPMRVDYSAVYEEQSPLFSSAILKQEMAVTDRIGLLSDMLALTKQGTANVSDLVQLLSAYSKEDSTPVISCVEGVLSHLASVLSDDSERSELFREFCAKLVETTMKKVGWNKKPDDGHLTGILRASLIRMQSAYNFEDPEVQRIALERFESWSSDPVQNFAALPSDLKASVLRIVLKTTDDPSVFQKCIELAETVETNQEKNDIYSALGFVKSAELKTEVLDWCTNGGVRLQDLLRPIASVNASSAEGRELTWTYLKENFTRILKKVETASPSLFAGVITVSVRGFCTNEKADEIEEFFSARDQQHPLPLIQSKIKQNIEFIRNNANLLSFITTSPNFDITLRQCLNKLEN